MLTDDATASFMASNAFVGKIILAIATAVFTYYTFWLSVLPFVLIEDNNFIHSLFPPLSYGFFVPAAFGVLFIGGLSIFTLYKTKKYIKWF